jgi:hypothetical protein
MDLTLLKDLQSSLRNSSLSSSSLGSRLDLDEEEEIRDLIIKLESMESMQDSLALSSTMLDAIGNAPPETLQALRSFHSDHDFEKERVEYERLKLEEQITMLEKVIEDGIRQTNELQEIHHHEVEDLHSQILNLQKQVADDYLGLLRVELVLIFVCQRAVFSRDSFGRVYAVLLFATVRRSKADYRRF